MAFQDSLEPMGPAPQPLLPEVLDLRPVPLGGPKISPFSLRQWDSLWTYVREEGAVPTNNEAERALRKAVLWRKGSFGINSLAGALFVERILTIAGTAPKRGLDLLPWLTQAIQAHLNGDPTPAMA